ncbi:OmpA family protein [Lysobacter sp. CA196]|uniref:OmpA family protein n=1 Tax=Lysobacter sp. CA196 TaxID=3455606 RepID=UPI003F8D6857
MRISGWALALVSAVAVAACGQDRAADAAPATPPDRAASTAATATDGETDGEAAADRAAADAFPAIPLIVVPEIVGVTPAQRALESSMQEILNPIAGIGVSPARCDAGGGLIRDAGITSVDAQGNLSRNGDGGIFRIAADGSGTANFEGGLVVVNRDGSGSINGGEDGDDDAVVRVEADGSGSYNGPAGMITLDAKGAGTWNGEGSLIRNNGDGSGTWNGPLGLVTINKDGSGTWNGPQGLIRNNGDGTGQVGTPARNVKMEPLAKVPPAGRFPPIKKFAPPGAPCGYLITLNDRVLFDFDKSDIRADAAKVLDTLAGALKEIESDGLQSGLEIGGHTDAKGSDDYNQSLSARRADAVVEALQHRGAADDASAKGYGESLPVAPNEIGGQDNPGGRQLNRRVEIFVRR